MLSAKIKELKLSKYKKTAPLLSNASLSFCLFIFLCYSFGETISNIDCAHLLQNIRLFAISNCSHTIYPQSRIMPLERDALKI